VDAGPAVILLPSQDSGFDRHVLLNVPQALRTAHMRSCVPLNWGSPTHLLTAQKLFSTAQRLPG